MKMTPDAEVVVIGGGLAGLAAAAYIAKAGRSVTVLERGARLGGRASTDDRDGFRFNQGPHALYVGGAGAAVLRELNIDTKGAPPDSKGKVVFDGELHIAPGGPVSMVRTKALGFREKVKLGSMLNSLPKLDPKAFADVSVSDWVDGVADTSRTRALLHALARLTTYGNSPEIMSAEVAISQMQMGLDPGVLYLDNGWQSLVHQLAATPGVSVKVGETVTEIPDAPVVIVAAGGPKLAEKLLGTSFDVGPPSFASCLDMGLSEAPANNFVIGGDLPMYFSNHSASAKLAPQGMYHVATVQYLGDNDEPDPDAIDSFARLSGVEVESIAVQRRLHRMTTVTAMATAARGGFAGRPTVDAGGRPNVFLAGDWIGPTGHLADASLASAKEAAGLALAALEKSPSVR